MACGVELLKEGFAAPGRFALARGRGDKKGRSASTAFLARVLALAAVCFVSLPALAYCAGSSVLERSELSTGFAVRNYRLITQDGDYLPFHSLKGRPVLVSFMYIDCHGPCYLINQSIKDMLAAMDKDVTSKLMTLSISVDNHNDNPARLKEYGAAFSSDFGRWAFATTDDETLGMMVRDLGFTYEKKADGYEHLNRLTLIGPDGAVARHFYGTEYDPDEVEEAVRAVIDGRTVSSRITDSFSRFLIYCSNYDPVTKTYRVNYTFIFAVVIQYILIMATIAYFVRGRIGRFFSRFSGAARGARA